MAFPRSFLNVRALPSQSQACNASPAERLQEAGVATRYLADVDVSHVPSTVQQQNSRSLLSFMCVFFFLYAVCLCISWEVNKFKKIPGVKHRHN